MTAEEEKLKVEIYALREDRRIEKIKSAFVEMMESRKWKNRIRKVFGWEIKEGVE